MKSTNDQKISNKKFQYFDVMLNQKNTNLMANEFKPDVGKKIPKGKIKQWQADYQNLYPGQTQSVFFGRTAIEAILKDTTLSGISILFMRKSENGQVYNDVALVGTTLDGKLRWKATGSSGKDMHDDEGDGLDSGLPCPTICPTDEP